MRPDILIPLFASVTSQNGVGPKLGKLVEGLCGPTVSDVLWHLPNGVNHRIVYENPEDVVFDALGTVQMKIAYHNVPPNKRVPYRIGGIALDRNIELVFFNYHKSYQIGRAHV